MDERSAARRASEYNDHFYSAVGFLYYVDLCVDSDDVRYVRLLLLVVVLVIMQVTIFPHLRLFGVVPDLGLLVAVAVGYQDGPEAGALIGFVAGFGYDLFLETPIGLNALAYALVGYGVGVLEAGLFRSPRWLPSFLGFLGGLAGGLLFIAVGVLAGVEAVKGSHAVQDVLLAAVYDALLAPIVFFLVRKVSGNPDRLGAGWSQ
jgi:rod shape-determining protein MreD